MISTKPSDAQYIAASGNVSVPCCVERMPGGDTSVTNFFAVLRSPCANQDQDHLHDWYDFKSGNGLPPLRRSLKRVFSPCLTGPKTQSIEMLGKLIDAGMNVLRMNFSHGSHEYHAQTIENIRNYASQCKNPKSAAILLDTKGPEIRTGKLRDHKDVKLKSGELFTFHNNDAVLGDETQVSTSYKSLAVSVKPGDSILVDDGLIEMKVLECNLKTSEVKCRIENDGFLGETKGVNLPGIAVDLPAITEKDAADIAFGVRMGVDLIAASFIRKASDVLEIRKLIQGTNIKIISKIENQEGLTNFDEILTVSDGLFHLWNLTCF